MTDEKLLTLRDVADRTGLSVKTLRRWIKKGDLQATQAGRKYFVTTQAFDKTFKSEARDETK